jgi:hypothetical protein
MNSSRYCLVASLTLAASAIACAPSTNDEGAVTGDESNLTEGMAPRAGSSIHSPSVDPGKTYWGSRNIVILQQVGYLTNDEARVALRADGILVNTPPNGRLGVDELAVLESRAATLFPAEKAVIPKLWKALEKAPAPTQTVPTPTIATTVVSAYASQQPFKLPIAQLAADARAVAARIELTQNDDGDPATISGADIAKTDRGSYLPQEAALFKGIAYRIAQAAPPITNALQHVDVQTPSHQTAVIASGGGVDLVATTTVGLAGRYDRGGLPAHAVDLPRLVASSVVDAAPSAGTNTAFTIVHLDLTNGADALVGPTKLKAGRIEFWANGVRLQEVDLAIAPAAAVALPLGFDVHLDGVKHELGCPKDEPCAYDSPTIGPLVYERSYMVAGVPGTTVDVFPNGRAVLKANGAMQDCYPTAGSVSLAGPPAWQAIRSCEVFSGPSRVTTITFGAGEPGLAEIVGEGNRVIGTLYPL